MLLFLVVGMLFGSDGLGLQFHNAKEAQFIGMVALSIILFSGGMDTKFTEIKPILSPGIVLSTFGVLLTALFTGLFIWWLSGMSWTNIHLPLITSLLLASTMSSTDSASVFAILRSQKMNLKHNLRPMLELESGSNDPMAYMLTVVLIQLIQSSGMGASQIAFSFVIQFVVGAAAGYLLGKLAIWPCGGEPSHRNRARPSSSFLWSSCPMPCLPPWGGTGISAPISAVSGWEYQADPRTRYFGTLL